MYMTRLWKGRRQVRYLCRFDPCRDNATLVTEAVSNDGRALQYASENLRRATWHHGWLLDFLEFFFLQLLLSTALSQMYRCSCMQHTDTSICSRTPARRTISSWWRHWSRIQRPHQSFNQPAPNILGWSRPFQAVSSYVSLYIYINIWYTFYIYIYVTILNCEIHETKASTNTLTYIADFSEQSRFKHLIHHYPMKLTQLKSLRSFTILLQSFRI